MSCLVTVWSFKEVHQSEAKKKQGPFASWVWGLECGGEAEVTHRAKPGPSGPESNPRCQQQESDEPSLAAGEARVAQNCEAPLQP